jgi:hypothetical protein
VNRARRRKARRMIAGVVKRLGEDDATLGGGEMSGGKEE